MQYIIYYYCALSTILCYILIISSTFAKVAIFARPFLCIFIRNVPFCTQSPPLLIFPLHRHTYLRVTKSNTAYFC